MSAIKGNIELILAIAEKNEVLKFANSALKTLAMLNIYVEDILDLGRIQKGAFQFNPMNFKVILLINFSS
jgi:K+-sensing histidine kinase KdpD